MWRNLSLLAGLVPGGIVAGAMLIARRRAKRLGARPPMRDKLLRPAGFSLNEQLFDLWGQIVFWLALASFIAPLADNAFAASDSIGFATRIGYLLVFGVLAGLCSVVVLRKLKRIKAVRQGLLGELAMGELLQVLLRDGFRVFHDIPGDGKWNVDHIVVGPTGVFAIETKARTKRPGPHGEADYRAAFDGQSIVFPGFADQRPVEQAKRNAKWVANWLSQATGHPVAVQAVVALPGWMVDRDIRGCGVMVLSGKEVASFIKSGKPQLSEATISRIAYQIEQKCRDVQF